MGRLQGIPMRKTHEVVTAWAFELPGWREAVDWQRLDLDAG